MPSLTGVITDAKAVVLRKPIQPWLVEAPAITFNMTYVRTHERLAGNRREFWPSFLLSMIFLGAGLAQVALFGAFGLRKAFCRLRGQPDRTSYGQIPGDKTMDLWALPRYSGIFSHLVFLTFISALCTWAGMNDAYTNDLGLAWELYAVFISYNVMDCIVQAIVRGFMAPPMLETSKLMIMSEVITKNVPILSPRIDMLKDMIFLVMTFGSGFFVLGGLAVFDFIFCTYRTCTRLRVDLMYEMLPVCKPVGGNTFSDKDLEHLSFVRGGPLWNKALKVVITKLEAASTPLKIEEACFEHLPQAVLQLAYLIYLRQTSVFVGASLTIAVVKTVVVFSAMRAFLGRTPRLLFCFRHLKGGPIAEWKLFASERAQAISTVAEHVDGVLEIVDAGELLDVLAKGLVASSARPRAATAVALGALGRRLQLPEDLIAAIRTRLLDTAEDEDVRKAAASALAALSGSDLRIEVRRGALKAVGDASPSAQLPKDVVFAVGEAYHVEDLRPVATEVLVVITGQAKHSETRRLAVDALEGIGSTMELPPEALAVLVAALMDPEMEVRNAAVGAFESFSRHARFPQGAIPVFAKMLRDDGWPVRQGAALALAKAACIAPLPNEAMPLLTESLWDCCTSVRKAAARALKSMADDVGLPEETAAALAKAASRQSDSVRKRCRALPLEYLAGPCALLLHADKYDGDIGGVEVVAELCEGAAPDVVHGSPCIDLRKGDAHVKVVTKAGPVDDAFLSKQGFSVEVSVLADTSELENKSYKNPVISRHGPATGWELRLVQDGGAVFLVTLGGKHHEVEGGMVRSGTWTHIAASFSPEGVARLYIEKSPVAEERLPQRSLSPEERHLLLGRNIAWPDRRGRCCIRGAALAYEVLPPGELLPEWAAPEAK